MKLYVELTTITIALIKYTHADGQKQIHAHT